MGETAIHHAATAGNADCIRMLLSHSKKWMDDTNSRGETALHLAAAGGHFDCVKMLLLMGNTPEWKHEFINRKDSRQEDTALHKACEYGHTKVARMLIDEGAVVHAFNVLARTPLHYAAANRDPELVTFLIRAGANHLATDCDGRRPIQHVVHDEVRRGRYRSRTSVSPAASNAVPCSPKQRPSVRPG
jgi:ankyrin repeat protein